MVHRGQRNKTKYPGFHSENYRFSSLTLKLHACINLKEASQNSSLPETYRIQWNIDSKSTTGNFMQAPGTRSAQARCFPPIIAAV